MDGGPCRRRIETNGPHTDPAQRSELDQIFEFWSSDADADKRSNFGGIQTDVARGLVVDGEAFAHVISTDSGPKIRLIPPELIDESYTRELDGGYVVSGIEFNQNADRVAYWIRHDRPFSQFSGYGPPRRVDANEILHIMRPLAAGQVRGISWLAPAIMAASDLDQLTDALRVGVKVSAMHAGFLVDQNGLGGEVYDGNAIGGILESGLEPGTLKRLPTGMDVKFNTPPHRWRLIRSLNSVCASLLPR
ncbi:MAG: phage portal protein [Alphaproteobacteria bacterium]|nr:phage portal protein [Alphaproteobacteria bacterium]